jgi:hypothetical protein
MLNGMSHTSFRLSITSTNNTIHFHIKSTKFNIFPLLFVCFFSGWFINFFVKHECEAIRASHVHFTSTHFNILNIIAFEEIQKLCYFKKFALTKFSYFTAWKINLYYHIFVLKFIHQIYKFKGINLKISKTWQAWLFQGLSFTHFCWCYIDKNSKCKNETSLHMLYHMTTLNSFPMLFFSLKLHLVKYWLLQLYSYI